MSEQSPERAPGHLDIDAVSAYVDHDFGPDDLTTIEIHLGACPACQREVLEIRTTVLLLTSLPQYAPRRSFCLGHDHARANRRPGRRLSEAVFPAGQALPGQLPLAPSAPPPGMPRYAAWLPGLQAAAFVVGALLLLVTVSDLTGISPAGQSPMQLAAPTALAQSEPPQAAMPAPENEVIAPAAQGEPVAGETATDDSGEAIAAFQTAPDQANGTGDAESASEGVPADGALPRAPRPAATVAIASVTQAATNRTTLTAQPANPAPAPANPGAVNTGAGGQSRLRMVQLTLGVLLAWLIVTIAGLRWIRRSR